MKKIILTVFLILTIVLGLVSCVEKPELDLKDAEKNLKGEDYDVEIEDEDNLDAGIEEILVAYSDKDYIYIVRYESKKYAKLNYNMLKQEQDAEIEAIELEIKQIEYMLKNYEDDLDSDEIDDYEDEVKELKEELEELQEDYAFGIKGKVVWMGTPKAVEDSKK